MQFYTAYNNFISGIKKTFQSYHVRNKDRRKTTKCASLIFHPSYIIQNSIFSLYVDTLNLFLIVLYPLMLSSTLIPNLRIRGL